MSFSYNQLDDDDIESIGNVQVGNNQETIDDQTFCPQRPILRRWPLCIGILEIIVGLICAGLGSVYIFFTPLPLVTLDGTVEYLTPSNSWTLDIYTSYGAAIWSGCVLVLAGSLAVRASRWKTRLNVQHFYVVTVFGFLFNLAMIILILWSYQQMFVTKYNVVHDDKTNKDKDVFIDCYHSVSLCKDIQKYSVISLLASVFCVLGCLLLALASVQYFMSVMFGEVQLVKSFIFCCFPCCVPYCKLPPSKSSSCQSVDDEEPNLIV